MALSPEEKQRMLVILTLLSQGQAGRNTLSALQPLLTMYEQKQAESKAKKEQRRAERNAIFSQVGGLGGSLGGMYILGKAMAPAAAAAPVTAGAPAVAAPNLIGAKLVSTAPAAQASTLSSLGSVALPAAAIIAGLSETWEGGAKDIFRGRGNRQDWTNMGVNAVTGVAPNLVLRWLGKPSIGRMMTSGKSDAQLMRDDFRGVLKEKGIVDNDYNVTLADGSKFNLGLDGKTKYSNADGKTTRNAWDVDLQDPLAQYAASKIDPYIRKMYGAGDPKKGMNPEQYTGMVVNAVTKGAKSKEEVDANINAVLGNKPFEGTAPVRANAAPAPQATQPSPQAAPPVRAGPAPQPAPAPQAAPAMQQQPSIQDVLRPPTPAPSVNPAPAQELPPQAKPAFMAPPQNAQPTVRPPAPLPAQSAFSGPAQIPPPQAKPGAQGMLSFGDQLKQLGKDASLNDMLNMLKNLQQQGGAKA